MTTPKKPDAQTIARECVAQYLSLDHVMIQNSEVFGVVFEAVQKEQGSMSQEKRNAIHERVRAALPGNLWDELRRVDDANNADVSAAERAGYLIGFEMGLRLAGGARVTNDEPSGEDEVV